jgi:hypothetical protein
MHVLTPFLRGVGGKEALLASFEAMSCQRQSEQARIADPRGSPDNLGCRVFGLKDHAPA